MAEAAWIGAGGRSSAAMAPAAGRETCRGDHQLFGEASGSISVPRRSRRLRLARAEGDRCHPEHHQKREDEGWTDAEQRIGLAQQVGLRPAAAKRAAVWGLAMVIAP
jgi:hypothetical protein